MIRQLSLAFAASLLMASTVLAQSDRARTTVRTGAAIAYARGDGDRLVLGLSTSSGGARDTLGLLISSIAAGGPAEKAGLEEGNRLVEINGVGLRLNASDATDPEMAGVLGRRLQRELDKMKPGQAVSLRVYANGQTREVKVTPVRADELNPGGMARSRLDSRSTIGVSVGGYSSPRDTLGVFVIAVAEDGPLAKAGVFEGSRIASINGVDLRVPAADVGDEFMTSSRIRRMTREVEKIEAGGNAELRVYTNGQYRNVTVKTVKRSDLKQDNAITIFQSGGARGVFMPPMGLQFDGNGMRFEMDHIGDGVRQLIEEFKRGTELEMQRIPREIWRDGDGTFEPREQPQIKPRSGGGGETLPVEDVLRQLEQRLRESQTPATRPFRAAAASAGTNVMASPLGDSFTSTFSFEPAIARSNSRVSAGVPDVQGVSASAGSTGGQGRSTGMASYRSSASAQGGAFTIDGIRMSAINANLASYLGRGSERGLLVLEIGDEWTGIAAGDVILSIDGRAVRDADGIRVEIRDESRDQSVELLRNGATVKAVLRRR